jgi:RNA polymerase sigma factor (sigma-70 family)
MTMHTMGDWELLQAYVASRSETAFAELVRRHLNWVYSTALRQVGDRHLAEDVAQAVFVLLARRSADLRPGTLLGGWLFRTTRFVASHALRSELRRKSREAMACTMSNTADSSETIWPQLAPHLDRAVADLSAVDRSAILLRFYEKLPLREVGERLGISEDAAKKRVGRALEKLRTVLERRGGVTLTGGLLTAILTERTVQSASITLASVVVRISLVSMTSAGPVLPTLVTATLRAWRWTKIKFAMGLTGASLALFCAGVGTRGLVTRHADVATSPPVSPKTLADGAAVSPDAGAGDAAKAGEQTAAGKKTGVITGWVIDERGRPLAGATVWGGFGSQPFATDVTDQFGNFALDKATSPTFVTVTRDGFGADQHEFDLENPDSLIVFRLNAVPALKVRVVDEANQGVGGAKAFLQRWWGRSSTLDQHWPSQTDGEGRLQWLGAPRGELQIEFWHDGYRYSRTNKLAADGQEHTIVLHPTASVSGSVTDADTGEPIERFRLTQGHAQPWVPTDPVPMWDPPGRMGSNGFYRAIIAEEPAAYLRIEADGYETAETSVHITNALEAMQDFALRRVSVTNSIRGLVLQPDGMPAVGLEVALCTSTAGVMLKGTEFEPDAFGNLSSAEKRQYRKKTDQQGAFSFAPKPWAHTVVAVGPTGLGWVRCFDTSQPLEIRLQAWGRVEGIVRTCDGLWADRKVRWQKHGNLTSWMTLFHEGLSRQSESSGRFVLEQVPPGDGRVIIESGTDFAAVLSPVTTVNPGQTVQVQVGGVGRKITGRFVASPKVEIRDWSRQVSSSILSHEFEPYPLPKNFTGHAIERWKLEFEESEAGRVWFQTSHRYDFKVEPDGSFSIPEVLPGRYRLSLHVAQGALGSGKQRTVRFPEDGPQIAWAGMKVVVTEAAEGGESVLDLGEIMLKATQ